MAGVLSLMDYFANKRKTRQTEKAIFPDSVFRRRNDARPMPGLPSIAYQAAKFPFLFVITGLQPAFI
jgi:hypothetical protein